MNLTIDIGNTCTKIMVFDDTIPVYRKAFQKITPSGIKMILKNFSIESCMLSSVVNVNLTITNILKKIPNFKRLSASTKIPIKNRYKTPATLGNDRLANVIAASFLFPAANVLVIDSGTCIKYDFINSKKEYLGGSISPGLEMRFKALHQFTGKLPLIKKKEVKKITGNTTEEAILTGVILGIQEEIKGFIKLYGKQHSNLKIVLTGGDSFRFAEELNLTIFAAADLVNMGLNEIIRFNSAKRIK